MLALFVLATMRGEPVNIEELAYKRIQRVRSADWLSFTDLCFHCGYTETTMRDLTRRSDFPTPSAPTESGKGKRWSKEKVNAWMDAHSEPVGNVGRI